jgi:hypothetical protein
MLKQIGVVFTCASIFFYACGCGTVRDVSLSEFKKDPHSGIRGVRLTSGEAITFADRSNVEPFYANGSIVGRDQSGKLVGTPESRIDSVSYFAPATVKSLALVAGGAIIVAGSVFLLTFSVGSSPR